MPLFIAQIIAHLSIIPMLFWADIEHYFITFIVYFFTGCIGMSMTYHRLLAHGSWKAPRWFEIFGTLCAVLGLTGSSLTWCSVHREHHMKSDKPEDPHSPIHIKWWKVQFLSMFFKPRLQFMRYKLNDPFHKFIHKNYFLINLAYALVLVLIEPFSLVYAWLFPAVILWNSGSLVNTAGHLFGYRNFKTADESKNNLPLALWTWGEGFHNNHHYNPANYSFKQRWFEFDMGGFLIRLIKKTQYKN